MASAGWSRWPQSHPTPKKGKMAFLKRIFSMVFTFNKKGTFLNAYPLYSTIIYNIK
jgi:hypothetical protein